MSKSIQSGENSKMDRAINWEQYFPPRLNWIFCWKNRGNINTDAFPDFFCWGAHYPESATSWMEIVINFLPVISFSLLYRYFILRMARNFLQFPFRRQVCLVSRLYFSGVLLFLIAWSCLVGLLGAGVSRFCPLRNAPSQATYLWGLV